MTGADELRERLSHDCDLVFLESHALVALQNWIAGADDPIAIANCGGHMRDLEASWLALADGAAENLERFEKERSDEVRLETPCLGAFHVFPDVEHATGVHRIVCQCAVFEEVLAMLSISKIVHRLK